MPGSLRGEAGCWSKERVERRNHHKHSAPNGMCDQSLLETRPKSTPTCQAPVLYRPPQNTKYKLPEYQIGPKRSSRKGCQSLRKLTRSFDLFRLQPVSALVLSGSTTAALLPLALPLPLRDHNDPSSNQPAAAPISQPKPRLKQSTGEIKLPQLLLIPLNML